MDELILIILGVTFIECKILFYFSVKMYLQNRTPVELAEIPIEKEEGELEEVKHETYEQILAKAHRLVNNIDR